MPIDGGPHRPVGRVRAAGAHDTLRCSTCTNTHTHKACRVPSDAVQEWFKPDRRYCAWEFFRARETSNPEALGDEAACLAEQAERNRTCQLEQCSQCTSQCTYPVVEAAVAAVSCTVQRDGIGQQYCAFVSDMGQWMNAHHGAVRRDGFPPVPEKVFAESYEICTMNRRGRVARDGISCRKEHRSSARGHFTAGFDSGGNPVRRRGFIVTCQKDSDCRARCPTHPLSGEHYFCQKKYALYDYSATSDDNVISFHDRDEPHTEDPDPDEMARNGDTGICLDMVYLVRKFPTPSPSPTPTPTPGPRPLLFVARSPSRRARPSRWHKRSAG